MIMCKDTWGYVLREGWVGGGGVGGVTESDVTEVSSVWTFAPGPWTCYHFILVFFFSSVPESRFHEMRFFSSVFMQTEIKPNIFQDSHVSIQSVTLK